MPRLKALRQYAAVVDLQPGEVGTATARCAGTFPQPGGAGDETGEGAALDRNGQPYRWHNFMVLDYETYQQLAEEYGEDQDIPWETLYDHGFGASEFTRVLDIDRGLPRGLPADIVVQKQINQETGEVQLNVISHEMQEVKHNADVFAEEKQNGSSASSTPIDEQHNQNQEEETVAA